MSMKSLEPWVVPLDGGMELGIMAASWSLCRRVAREASGAPRGADDYAIIRGQWARLQRALHGRWLCSRIKRGMYGTLAAIALSGHAHQPNMGQGDTWPSVT